MKAGIMQPYFFPYLGYFSLIKHTDIFILFDPVQFIRHGWIERNRVLKQNEGWLYVQVPLASKGRDVLIENVTIDNAQDWKNKLRAQLQPYKKKAPFYYKVVALLDEILSADYTTITELNFQALKTVCGYLGIETKIHVFSNMNLKIDQPHAADEWALNICKALGNITEYWNPPGGISFFDKTKYDAAGIELKFQNVLLKPYDQKREMFEPGLSIIDVMMFNSPQAINEMLDEYDFL